MNKSIARECSRWPQCSVNNCPLEPNPVINPLDKEPKCTMAKANRMRIAARHPGVLPIMGMMELEFMFWKKRQNRTPEQVKAMADTLLARLAAHGYRKDGS